MRLLLCADAKRSHQNECYGFNATSKQVKGLWIFFVIHEAERNMNLNRDNNLPLRTDGIAFRESGAALPRRKEMSVRS